MLTRLLLSATALAAIAGSAMAADLYEPAPMVAPVMAAAPASSWTGFYVGVHGGAAFNPHDAGELEFSGEGTDNDDDGIEDGGDGADDDGPLTGIEAAFGDNYSGAFEDSFTGGVHLGYDHQFGSFVLGALADIRALDVEQEQSAFSATPAFYTERRSIDYLATARLRLGYDVGGAFLPYITGGLAYADATYEFDTNSGAFQGADGDDDNHLGYALGAGVEARVMGGFSVGLEYLYVNLGESDFEADFSGGADTGGGDAFGITGLASTQGSGSDEDFDFHLIEAKISYRF